jgi:hypothetical protein
MCPFYTVLKCHRAEEMLYSLMAVIEILQFFCFKEQQDIFWYISHGVIIVRDLKTFLSFRDTC